MMMLMAVRARVAMLTTATIVVPGRSNGVVFVFFFVHIFFLCTVVIVAVVLLCFLFAIALMSRWKTCTEHFWNGTAKAHARAA